jgi:hypothetical protein
MIFRSYVSTLRWPTLQVPTRPDRVRKSKGPFQWTCGRVPLRSARVRCRARPASNHHSPKQYRQLASIPILALRSIWLRASLERPRANRRPSKMQSAQTPPTALSATAWRARLLLESLARTLQCRSANQRIHGHLEELPENLDSDQARGSDDQRRSPMRLPVKRQAPLRHAGAEGSRTDRLWSLPFLPLSDIGKAAA